MRRKLAIGLAVFLIIFITWMLIPRNNMGGQMVFKGRMLVNDAGVPIGGFEWVGEYSVELIFDGSIGYMDVELESGLGDPLTKHRYVVKSVEIRDDLLIVELDSGELVLKYVEVDEIWGRYNSSYTAIWSPLDSKYNMGSISPGIFQGFVDHYYIELHLWRGKGSQ